MRVLTEPAFLDVMATRIGWTYGAEMSNVEQAHRAQRLASALRKMTAISRTRPQNSLVGLFRKPGEKEAAQDEARVCGNGQQVGLEDIEAQRPQL